jgi:uncharacterized protein
MDVLIKQTDKTIGYGVFAARTFKQGESVLKPTGTIIDHQTRYSIQIDWDKHLDPDEPAKYLNHSCDPNMGIHTGADMLPEFIALRDIQTGEEMSFDYAMSEYQHYARSNPAEEIDLSCHCGADDCRGRLGYFSELDESLKEKYAGYISAYLVNHQADSEETSSTQAADIPKDSGEHASGKANHTFQNIQNQFAR